MSVVRVAPFVRLRRCHADLGSAVLRPFAIGIGASRLFIENSISVVTPLRLVHKASMYLTLFCFGFTTRVSMLHKSSRSFILAAVDAQRRDHHVRTDYF